MDEGRDPMARRTREEAASCYAGFMRARMNSSDEAKSQMTVKSQSCGGGKPDCGRSEVSCLENVVKEELVSESKSGRSDGNDSDCSDETEFLLVDSELVAESFDANSRNVEKNGVERLDSDGAGNVVAPESVQVTTAQSLPHVYDISSDSGNEELSNNDVKGSESEVERESPSWTMDHENSASSDSDDSSSDEDFWAKKSSKSYRSNKSAANQMPISICKKKETEMVEEDEDENSDSEDDSHNAQDFHPKQMHVGMNWKKGKEKGEEDENKKRTRPITVDRSVKGSRKMKRVPKLNFPVCQGSTRMAGRLRSSQTKKMKYNEGGTRVIILSSDEHENCASSDEDDDDENVIEKTHNQGKMITKENEIVVLDG